ncbi:MAG: hypothetical protein QOC71_426 [Thermoplasmata archaeon]|jgi:hypothetical protein|nr:hypothetical protein [Thermoplasmata archaeon]
MDMLRAAPALLALLVALAGCSDDPPATAAPSPTTEPTTSMTADPVPEEPAGRLDATVLGESRTNFDLTDCLNPRILFVLEPADAQALLPPGFTAADVTALTQFTGAPFGSPVPAGRAVGGYDFLSCTGNTLDNGSVAFSQVGILVQPPDLGDRTPLEPATYDLYLLALHSNKPAWHALALSMGFSPEEAPLAEIASAATDHGGGNVLGSGSVSVGTPLGAADYVLPAAGRQLDLQARYWHVSAAGTSYLDFHLDETVQAGAIPTCTHAAGSAFEKVSGVQTCGAESRFAAVGIGTQVAGTAYWLPGVFPVDA